jgi:16S rRNA (adenine1518-N6/adenine1519-N6)-dimethyltransferase
VRIDVDPTRRTNRTELRHWHRFVRDLFLHRRKTLRSAIASVPGFKHLKPKLDELLDQLDLTGEVRAERLSPEELMDLWQGLERLENEAGHPHE